MKKIAIIVLFVALWSCSQGVRVENEFVDEIEVLTNLSGSENGLKIIGHKSGAEYFTSILAVADLSGNISKIVEEEDDLFLVYTDEMKIVSLDEDDYTLVRSYDVSDLGTPIDIHFPNTSNGYFTVEGKDSIYILDRISRDIASLKIHISGQPTKLISKGNKLFVANSSEESLSVIATNTKNEVAKVSLPGKAMVMDLSNDDELVVICVASDGQPKAVYINIANNSISEVVDFNIDANAEKFPDILSIEITPEEIDYAWVGTDEGVFRLDLRNKSEILYYNLNTAVYDIYFNTRQINDEIFYLGKLPNGATKLEVVDPQRFSTISNIIISDDTQTIFPFF